MQDIEIDWESLEDAFKDSNGGVRCYLHRITGDVLRFVDGVEDPRTIARIAADASYLRIPPARSRVQFGWMERYIPTVQDANLQRELGQAIEGKGAFRRFKDLLMAHGPERARWLAFRCEQLRLCMEAWLRHHALNPVARPLRMPDRSAEILRRHLREIADTLGPHELDTLITFAEFIEARSSARRREAWSSERRALPAASGERSP